MNAADTRENLAISPSLLETSQNFSSISRMWEWLLFGYKKGILRRLRRPAMDLAAYILIPREPS
jgi:hypothetical protein